MGARARLDVELVRRGLAASRTAARQLIADGAVQVASLAVPKPASQVRRDEPIEVISGSTSRFASRGGIKLTGALDDLAVTVEGLACLDAGAAHGGFSDVLLRRGAAHVVAVDVAYGQFDWHLRHDPRVTLLERTNVRHLALGDLGEAPRPALAVADLSFISLTKVLPALATVLQPDATLLPMVKPQFEVGRRAVGRGGVVRDPAGWANAMETVTETAAMLGFALIDAAPSRAPGPAGNVEFFLLLSRPADARRAAGRRPEEVVRRAVERGQALREAGPPSSR